MHPIGEVARRSGVTIETIRYYEREGVVPLPDRSASGRRLYDSAGIARLRFVKRCRDLGFPIEDIRALLALSKGDSKACSDVKLIGERHLRDVRDKIADLTRLEAALADLVAECDEQRPHCPVLRQLFAD
ncbi:MAG: MerR family DNA-binding protein [Kiloniellaceae bacterium]|nr:MerR family DNA-binding protein [Kiloniellaceae bacterium]